MQLVVQNDRPMCSRCLTFLWFSVSTATGRGPSSEHMSELARISGLPPTIGAHSTADAEGRVILCTPTQKLLLRANLSERGVKSSSVSPAASVRRIFSVRSPDRSVSPLSVIDERRRLFVTVLEELAAEAAGELPLSSVAAPRTGENNERFDFNTRASENSDRSSCLLLLPARSFRNVADEVPPFCGLRNRARLDDSRVAGTCTWEHDLPPAALVRSRESFFADEPGVRRRGDFFPPGVRRFGVLILFFLRLSDFLPKFICWGAKNSMLAHASSRRLQKKTHTLTWDLVALVYYCTPGADSVFSARPHRSYPFRR